MTDMQRIYNLNNNQIVYTETGKTVVPKTLENRTKGTTIEAQYSPTKDGISRIYYGGGNEQYFTQNYFGKLDHPDYDFVEFTFKKDGKPTIAVNKGRLHKDGTFEIGNIVEAGEYIDANGKKRPITRKMNVEEANKLIEEFRSYVDELSPRVRRILSKIRKVAVW